MEPGEFLRLFRETEERLSHRIGSEVAVQIRDSEGRIKSQMKMHFEEMQSQLRMLVDHNARITALE